MNFLRFERYFKSGLAAMFNLKYNSTWGLDHKPSQKLADLIEAQLDDTQLELMEYNVNTFKKILNRG